MKFDLGHVKVRKRTRLPHWDVQHGIYFITFATAGRAFFMRDRRVAEMAANTITHFDEHRYQLLAWCVMSNHVHVLLALASGERLDRVIHSWKSFTAKRGNALLGREGEFWQTNYFDRSIRDARELSETVKYVLENGSEFVRSYPERIPV